MPARIVAVALLSLLYILGTHWVMTSAPPSPWNAVALLTPMIGAIALTAWQAGQRWRAFAAAAVATALVVQAAVGVQMPASLLYLGEHVTMNLALGFWFGGTLRPGSQALITRMASRVHRRVTPAMQVYTRNLTRVWTIYFFATAAASVGLFLTVSFDHWADFSNLACPVLIASLFLGERLLRYRLHPEFERSTITDQIRAYMEGGAASVTESSKPTA